MTSVKTFDPPFKLQTRPLCTTLPSSFSITIPQTSSAHFVCTFHPTTIKKGKKEREKKLRLLVSRPAPNSNPTCLEWRRLTLESWTHPLGAKVLKTKHKLPAKGQIIFGEKVWWKARDSIQRERLERGDTVMCISRTPWLCLFFFFFWKRKIENATQDVFSASFWQSQSRSGPLLLPPCNHGGGVSEIQSSEPLCSTRSDLARYERGARERGC